MVSVDVKQHWRRRRRWPSDRNQELCESLIGRPGLPIPHSPYGLCGRKATFELEHFRHYGRVQELCESRGGRPGLPAPNSPYGLCGRKVTFVRRRMAYGKTVRCYLLTSLKNSASSIGIQPENKVLSDDVVRNNWCHHQTNIETVSKATLVKLPRNGVERIWDFPSAEIPSELSWASALCKMATCCLVVSSEVTMTPTSAGRNILNCCLIT